MTSHEPAAARALASTSATPEPCAHVAPPVVARDFGGAASLVRSGLDSQRICVLQGQPAEPINTPGGVQDDARSWNLVKELKHDVFGRVELLSDPHGFCVRRIACGNGWPGTGLVAGRLLRREARALVALVGCESVPQLLPATQVARGELLRTYCVGEPLWSVQELPQDFFARLRELVEALHARGVCHNDLHKENNILVAPDGRPCVIDFQLASVHPARGYIFACRCAEDLTRVERHQRWYDTLGCNRGDPVARSRTAAMWRTFVKPIYNLVTRRLLGISSGEPRRPRGGPWPRRTPPVGKPAN